MEEALPIIITLVFRVIGAIVCYNKAEKLNRSTGGWTFFGIILPLIAIIWIQFMKPKIDWDNNNINTKKTKDVHKETNITGKWTCNEFNLEFFKSKTFIKTFKYTPIQRGSWEFNQKHIFLDYITNSNSKQEVITIVDDKEDKLKCLLDDKIINLKRVVA